jgi:hypothetical protein
MTQARNFLRILELGPKTMRALFVHKSLLDDDDACKESIFASQKLSFASTKFVSFEFAL